MKQKDLKDMFDDLGSVKSSAWGDLEDKFWNNPTYERFKKRYLEITEKGDIDVFTTVVNMKHTRDGDEHQGVIASGRSKELYVEKTGMNKKSAYNIGAFKEKVIVNGTNMRVSSFPKKLTKSYVFFYTDPGDTILDPFSGHNSRMSAVVETGRNYIGYDVAKYYVELIKEEYEKYDSSKVGKLTMHWESSENIMEADNTVDFIFTSPPFWNAEGYDDDPRQIGGRLSKIGSDVSYEQFLNNYQKIINQCYRVLKPGHFIGFNVEDLYRKGELYTLGVDTVDAFKRAGFTMTSIVTTPYNSVAKSYRIQKIVNGHIGKAHGYIVFARKGERLKIGESNDI